MASDGPTRTYYRVEYAGASRDVAPSNQLSQLRRQFNSSAAGSSRSTSAAATASTAASPAKAKAIPANARCWLRWDHRWVEVIDDDSLAAALNDAYFVAASQKAAKAGGPPIQLTFQAHDASPPSDPGVAVAGSSPAHTSALAELTADGDLKQRLQFLIHDLLKLKDDDRLVWDLLQTHASAEDQEFAATYSSLYWSSLYFSRQEQRLLACFPTPSGDTFAQAVQMTMSAKFIARSSSASSTGAHVCSSHDLAPLYRATFQLEDAFYKSSAFKDAYAKFEKRIKKTMKAGHSVTLVNPAEPVGSATVPSPVSSATSSSSSSLPADTLQLVKLLGLRDQLAALELGDKVDVKITKQIQALEKEVKRMEKKL